MAKPATLPPPAAPPPAAPPPPAPPPRWHTRLAWLAVFWVAGVATMGLVAGLLRGLMRLAGLSA